MGYPQKIVTCCYCGTRAALVLKGRTRHELSCASCGAPLHDLKMLPLQKVARRELGDRPRAVPKRSKHQDRPAKSHRKPRKMFKKFLEEAFDLIEDILD